MINHVVLFKLKEFSTEQEKNAARDKFVNALLGLKDKINVLKHIEAGAHYSLESPSFDVALITHFESLEDLEIYKVHPDHLKVVELVKEIIDDRAAVDFEF
jgi:hypothetical protein